LNSPPGHRLKIKRFTSQTTKLGKKKRSINTKKIKKIKVDSSPPSNSLDSTASINAATDEIRAKVLNLGKKQKLHLIENQHFTILVKNDIVDERKLCASIRCSCGKNYTINNKSSSWMISNWTRHSQTCLNKK
jgi:hypothetical protein